jgi:hypothetical protein
MSDILIKLTGLWERTRRGNTEGQFYLVGRLGAAKILAFKNHRKESDADPDWNLFLTEPTPPKERRELPTGGQRTYQAMRDKADEAAPAVFGSRADRDRHEQELAARFEPDTEIPF